MNHNKILYHFYLKFILLIIILFIFIKIIIYHKFYNLRSFLKIDLIRAKFIKKNYKFFNDELPNYNHTHIHLKKIFWCWLQGEEKAPKLYQACLNSVRRNIKDSEIILITQENINKYVHFPPYILQKFNNNQITRTHFSDLLRLELLIKYSGTWIDASVLLTEFNEIFFNNDLFFFQSFNNKNIAGSSWFLTSERENPILKSTRDLIYEYWRINDHLYNYFLFHYFFKISCDKYFDDFQKVAKFSNEPVHVLQKKLLQRFSEKEYKEILKNISVHKLTIIMPNKDDKELFYHYIIKEYMNSNK